MHVSVVMRNKLTLLHRLLALHTCNADVQVCMAHSVNHTHKVASGCSLRQQLLSPLQRCGMHLMLRVMMYREGLL